MAKKVKKKSAKKKHAKKNGRPTLYKSRYCSMLINFFGIEPFTEVKVPRYDEGDRVYKSGLKAGRKVLTHYEILRNPNRLPTLQRFAKKIGVSTSSVYRWIDEKDGAFQKKFRDAFTHARVLRQNFLMENGLVGTHNPGYAKFVATNLTDMKDSKQQELVGEDGGPLPPIQVNVIKK